MSDQKTLGSIFSHSSASHALIIPSSENNSNPPIKLYYPDLKKQLSVFQNQLYNLTTNIQSSSQHSVAIVLPNSLELTITFLGVTLSRNIAAPLNPNYTLNEFKFYLEDSQSKVVFVPRGSFEKNISAVKAAKDFDLTIFEIWWDLVNQQIKLDLKRDVIGKKANKFERKEVVPKEDDVALLLHTSGTTGRPKGVPLTHKNLTTTMNNIVETYKFVQEDRTLLVMPLFHVHGLICGLLATLLSGGTVVIPPKFSATTFWKDFLENECTWYTAVPTIHQILLLHPLPPNGVPKLRFIRSCSSSLAPVTLARLEQSFKVPVLEAYAMTEAAHQVTSNPLPPASHKPGSVGIRQGVQVAILDETGDPTHEGEVCIKGDNVTHGYLNNPSANKSSYTKDGWFRTGDQGKFDEEGYLFLTGRIKELINRGGEKISPLEVDAVLLAHPAISDAVSFAVPDHIYGQEIHAAVVLNKEQQGNRSPTIIVTEKEIQEFCGKKLVKFKVPKRIYFTDLMPKTATGKIQRKNVSEIFFKKSKL
ncbi:192_t:CDS:2 [Ambispora leptoticha]|uniref:192_t:CDS:1 n=1 Tax=Ambispora leptoticha TaxID=144679 RepID=A0A9N9GWG3_9GLOM|nr:192_t:CDS:2 [Ambispora leptoticha]